MQGIFESFFKYEIPFLLASCDWSIAKLITCEIMIVDSTFVVRYMSSPKSEKIQSWWALHLRSGFEVYLVNGPGLRKWLWNNLWKSLCRKSLVFSRILVPDTDSCRTWSVTKRWMNNGRSPASIVYQQGKLELSCCAKFPNRLELCRTWNT